MAGREDSSGRDNKSILITVPCLHWIHKAVVRCLLLLSMDKRYKVKIEWPSNKPYENNLHHIVKDFLEGGYDYWLSMDADNPPLENPLDLVALDKDIIGLPTPIWHYNGKPGERPIYWNVYKIHGDGSKGYNEWQPREGLQKVDAIGTGCFLIARRVFEDPNMQNGAFTRKLNPNGTVERGNDISFCERARECGFEVWAHFDYPCNHFSEIELNEVARAIKGLC